MAYRDSYLCAEIAEYAQRYLKLNMRRGSIFCAKSVRYNIFTNGAPQNCLKLVFNVGTVLSPFARVCPCDLSKLEMQYEC